MGLFIVVVACADAGRIGRFSEPPHIFNIADGAYRGVIEDKKNQAVVISGESGAGKTETTKKCLDYITTVAGSLEGVADKILSANPVLGTACRRGRIL